MLTFFELPLGVLSLRDPSWSRLHGHQECLVRVALRLAGRGSSVYDPTGASGLSQSPGGCMKQAVRVDISGT